MVQLTRSRILESSTELRYWVGVLQLARDVQIPSIQVPMLADIEYFSIAIQENKAGKSFEHRLNKISAAKQCKRPEKVQAVAETNEMEVVGTENKGDDR